MEISPRDKKKLAKNREVLEVLENIFALNDIRDASQVQTVTSINSHKRTATSGDIQLVRTSSFTPL